jgi:hypothetical protein
MLGGSPSFRARIQIIPTIASVPSGQAVISVATGHRLAMPMTKTASTAANAHSLREPLARMPEA